MTYTNKYNLPPEIVSVLTRDRYNPDGRDLGDYSATTICAPIQQTILKRRHPEQLKVQDVIDSFWAFTGSIAHAILEEQAVSDALVENRFFASVMGKKISGCIDHYKDGIITDYKTTKSYKVMRGDYSDWEKQLNVYAYLTENNGWPVEKLRIFVFILDWKQAEMYKPNYPACPIVELPLRLWTPIQRDEFMIRRVGKLIESEQFKDELLPPCTDKEMWRDVKDYAVMKEGQKRAVKCYEDKTSSLTHNLKCGEVVVKRMTARTRCHNYCVAAPLCTQHKQELAAEGGYVDDGEPCIF